MTPLRFQIRLRTMLGATALVALALWLNINASQWVCLLVFLGGLAITAVLIRVGEKPAPATRAEWRAFLALFALALGSGIWAATQAYYTFGEVASGILFFFQFLYVIPFALLVASRRKLAHAWLLVLFLLIVPEQVALTVKWHRCHAEATAIVAYIKAYQARTGSYPADLSGYAFRRPDLKGEFRYERDATWGFYLSYHLGSEGTSHDYRGTTGWFYYPD